ncbi:DUF924 family protein [Aquabacterium sp. J223]|uniref:DUF924 family protein n=1 Tax=Aquabacterium sp. J223 TaxID=2898431 RepID=UPI0021ADD3A8|nr:DUF924 family protein [Aquabacterium sp. J223]UUX94106.1 DUF924 domain-containing protein [Aquabacterium sp. J223]
MTPDEVLDFWFGPAHSAASFEANPAWFRKDPAFDAEIARRFGATIEQALAGGLADWQLHPAAALARILVLDQFTRNAFRDTPRAFAGDALALAAARQLVAAGDDRRLPPLRRVFAYLPFEHAEDRAMQAEALRLYGDLAEEVPALAGYLDWARKHAEVVERFGRFPHRNEVLGRPSSTEEEAFLRQPGSRF